MRCSLQTRDGCVRRFSIGKGFIDQTERIVAAFISNLVSPFVLDGINSTIVFICQSGSSSQLIIEVSLIFYYSGVDFSAYFEALLADITARLFENGSSGKGKYYFWD